MQFREHARKLLARNVEQRCVGEHAVEAIGRQFETQKILLPYFAPAVRARHRNKFRRSFDADRDVSQRLQCLQIAAGPAAEIEQHERRHGADRLEQRGDVLADIVVARSVAKREGVATVVTERARDDRVEIVLTQPHCRRKKSCWIHARGLIKCPRLLFCIAGEIVGLPSLRIQIQS